MSLEINNTLLNNNNEIIERIKTKASQININNSSEGVKLFATIDEMNADTAKEGDLAIVYSQDVSSMTATTETQTITFPRTVVLPEAFIDSIYTMLRAVDESMWADAQAILESSMFNFDFYGESINVSVQYESSDGITYTRIDGGAETIDLGTPIKCYYEEEWSDTLGYFMQVPSMYFGGLFKYTTNYRIDAISLPDLTTAEINYNDTSALFKFNDIVPVQIPIDKLSQVNLPTGYSFGVIYIDTNYNIKLIACPDYSTRYDRVLVDTNNNCLGICTYNTDTSKVMKRYTLDIDTVKLTDEEQLSPLSIDGFNGLYIPIDNIKSIPFDITAGNISSWTLGLMQVNQTMWQYDNINLYTYITAYIPAPTQLDATADYVYEKEFYGPNGVETGSLQETTQLTLKDLQLKSEIYNTLNHLIAPENMQNAFNSYTGASLDVSNIDIANTTNLQGAFQDMDNLVELDLTKWDTSNIKNMYYTFTNNNKLERLLLGDTFTTQNVVTIGGAFSNNPLLQELDLHNMTLNKITNIDYLFWKCTSLRKLDISKCDFTNITSYKDTFTNIPTDCLILVKDQAAKDWVLARRSDLTNVQIAN